MTQPISEKGRKNMGSAIGQPEPADYRESMFNWSTPVRKPERSSFKVGKLEQDDKSDSFFDFGSIESLKQAKAAKTRAWFDMRSQRLEIDLVESRGNDATDTTVAPSIDTPRAS
tara:strand:- start:270 stop:611 length:342 start_codon:yes stop_codon:yes gene_type:complete